nr:MAG TPA: hypothetical protein [Bacteriophage sp.]
MKIIEISALDNGAHRNQQGSFNTVPDGWAVIPESLTVPDTFPFVNIEVDGQTVTAITAGTVPEPEPVPEPKPTETEQLRADVDFLSAMMGVTL